MASSTLRPHRSPSPTPPTPIVNPASNTAKLMRQSLGPPTTAGDYAPARGFGVKEPAAAPSRHVSTSGVSYSFNNRDSLSPRPQLGSARAVSGGPGRPSSEFLPSGGAREAARTPEAEQIDQWFKHLAQWEATLEEMAAASTDQNFTEELSAIEQWFRVLSEAERTAALYSLLQHSTPVQIRFFLSVLQHMAQSDPMTAMLSPSPSAPPSLHAHMESKLAGMGLKSPVSSYVGAPGPNHYLAPDSALESSAQKARSLRQNRISAPGTLTASTDTRWSNQLDQVIERGPSPGLDDASVRSRSPQPDMRPKSTDFAGGAHEPPHSSSRSATPRHSAGPAAFGSGFGVGPAGSASALGLGHPSEAASPALSPHPSGSWASMTNTPLASAFSLASLGDNNTSHLAGLAAAANAAAANRDFRRPSAASRNVSGVSGFSDEARSPPALPAFPNPFGLPVPQPGADLAVLYSQLSLAATAQAQAQAAAQVQAAQAQLYGNLLLPGNQSRQPSGRVPSSGRRSPLPGQRVTSPNPAIAQQQGGGGGAGGGAGVAGPDDIDIKVLSDTSGWLRVLRLHKYTANFETTPWTDMVRMTDQDLQDKGVAAQGARSKFLKVFYNVRENRGLPHPPGQEKYAPGATEEEK